MLKDMDILYSPFIRNWKFELTTAPYIPYDECKTELAPIRAT